MKKLWLILGISILVLGVGSAAWYFIFGGDFRADVYSFSGGKAIIIPFKDFSLNTTDGSDFKNVNATFLYNRAGNFTVKITESITDTSGGNCTGGDNDCYYKVYLNRGDNMLIQINNSNKIFIPFNTNNKIIFLNLTCVAYACPQQRDYSIRLEEDTI